MSWNIERQETPDHVVVVTMNTNPVNAQNPTFFDDLHACFDRLESDYEDCAVVLRGQGSTFSAGLDLEHHFPLFASRDVAAIEEWLSAFQTTNMRIFTYPRPTVAAVNGNAFAGGLLTALSCDYRIGVDADVQIGLNEVQIGMPFPATYVEIIRYATGVHSITPATLFGRVYDPSEAREVGYLHELTAPDDLTDRAVEVAGSIDPTCFAAYAFTKQAFQNPVLDAVERFGGPLDQSDFETAVSDSGSTTAHARQYEAVSGNEPHWEY